MQKTILTKEVLESVKSFSLPTYDQLPDIGLYLEQATKYVNQCLLPLENYELTGSMIRNYVKMGLIENPVKKQYYRSHLAYLLALTVLKPVLSLDNINLMFMLQRDSYPLKMAYDYFGRTLADSLYFRFGIIEQFNETGITESFEKEMLCSAVTAVSHIIYLDTCYKLIAQKRDGSAKGSGIVREEKVEET